MLSIVPVIMIFDKVYQRGNLYLAALQIIDRIPELAINFKSLENALIRLRGCKARLNLRCSYMRDK